MALFDFSPEALPVIFSLEGTCVNEAERAFFRDSNPLGFILFARNVETPEQVRGLTEDLKSIVGRDCPVLIDQEGGRVQRLKPPVWRGYAAAATFGAIAENDLERGKDELNTRTMMLSEELRACGINVNCDPVCDVLCPETHDVIGDRAYSARPEIVAEMALEACRDYLRQGIVPIIKHIPGHGRAQADSHLELPVVDASLDEMEALDFVPFRHIAQSDIGKHVWAMSAHILYPALDKDLPLTLSEKSIADVVRGRIGFDGILVSDDVSMKALDAYGDLGQLCADSLAAGCDLALYCAGKLPEMQEIAESVPKLSPETLKRLQNGAFSL
jgi:beta-N-acetylhexosaminidase